MSESKLVKVSVTVNEQGEISIETNLPLLETTLLLQEGATSLLRRAREESYTKPVEDLPDAKEAE